MTAYATRAPLQLIDNPHIMSEGQGNARRTSTRLAGKEDIPFANGIGHNDQPIKKSQGSGGTGRPGKNGTTGTSSKAGGKRKPAYDEEEDGFAFTRTRSKKPKAEPVVPQPPIPTEKAQEEAKPPPHKRTRKSSQGSPGLVSADGEAKVEKRRTRRSGGSQDGSDPPPLPIKKRRKGQASAESKPAEHAAQAQAQPQDKEQGRTQPIEITFDAKKIALPFADTPIIRRNQEMRKGAANGSRRSSLGMRGRRASSLIDAGKSNALPHDEVESSEFYKHIESEGLSEPRRMRQLLTWCGTRALGEKPSVSSEDSNAILAAREIQTQILKDFSTKSDMSDWFNRNETTPPPSVPQPNPKSVSNLAKIHDLEQQISRLQTERQIWESILRPPSSTPMLPPLPQTTPSPSTISPSTLDSPTQTSALSTLQTVTAASLPSLAASTSQRLHNVTQNLEFTIDTFASNIHALESYTNAADRLAAEALGLTAQILEQRDREGVRRANAPSGEEEEGRGVGTREVLRGLSRVIGR